jgi:hypothetical protein
MLQFTKHSGVESCLWAARLPGFTLRLRYIAALILFALFGIVIITLITIGIFRSWTLPRCRVCGMRKVRPSWPGHRLDYAERLPRADPVSLRWLPSLAKLDRFYGPKSALAKLDGPHC